jgi:hypothetical protein
MYKVNLTLIDGSPVAIYFNNTVTVFTAKNSNTKELEVRVMDGNHNNGGWTVRGSYDEVMKLIDNAILYKRIV